MARIRTIKPEFFTSLTIADLTPEQRLTFIGLWTHVDDEGRCVDDPRLIKAAVWPLDDRTAGDVEDDLRALSESSLITRYTLKRKRYLAVTGWREHQRINRPTPSRLPSPEEAESVDHTPCTCGNTIPGGTHGGLSEDSPPERNREQGTGNRERKAPPPTAGPPKGATTSRGTALPDDFTVTPAMAAWAREKAPTCGPEDHEAFCDYWRGIPGAKGRKKDWPGAWRNWMRREHERRSARPATNANGARRSTADERVDQAQALKDELRADLNGDTTPFTIIRGELA